MEVFVRLRVVLIFWNPYSTSLFIKRLLNPSGILRKASWEHAGVSALFPIVQCICVHWSSWWLSRVTLCISITKTLILSKEGRLLTLLPATCRDPDKAGKFNLSPFPFVTLGSPCDPKLGSSFPSTWAPEEDVLVSINNILWDTDSHICSGMQHRFTAVSRLLIRKHERGRSSDHGPIRAEYWAQGTNQRPGMITTIFATRWGEKISAVLLSAAATEIQYEAC